MSNNNDDDDDKASKIFHVSFTLEVIDDCWFRVIDKNGKSHYWPYQAEKEIKMHITESFADEDNPHNVFKISDLRIETDALVNSDFYQNMQNMISKVYRKDGAPITLR